MRNYWMKIGLGALVVFLLGFVVVRIVGMVKHTVVHTLSSTDPIPFPLAFVDFKLDGRSVGSVSRAILLRDTPEHISGLTVVVSIPESARAGLSGCIMSLDNTQQINSKTTFRCRKAADTAGLGLLPFARIVIKGTGDTLPLLLPKDAVQGLQDVRIRMNQHGVEITSAADSLQALADSLEAVRDSAHEAISDSLHKAADRMTDSLTDAAMQRTGAPTSKPPQAKLAPPAPPRRP